MKPKMRAEARFALQVALNILEKYFSAEEELIWEEDIITGKVVDAIPGLEGFPSFDLLANWTFAYSVTYAPTCCAGECAEFSLEPIGNIDIITAGNFTYSFPLDILTHYEWKA